MNIKLNIDKKNRKTVKYKKSKTESINTLVSILISLEPAKDDIPGDTMENLGAGSFPSYAKYE